MSVRGKLFTVFTRKTQNINPIAYPDAIAKMKKMSEGYINEKVPKGCKLGKFSTANGSRYEIVTRNGCEGKKYILYFHGGAYVTGLLSMYRRFVMGLSENITGVLSDYSLAPESKYPTQLDEAYDVWNDLTQNRKIDPDDIIIGGDSSGGNLTLAFMLRLRDDGRKMPCGCFLLSPWTDMLMTGKSYDTHYCDDAQIGEYKAVLTEEKRRKLINSDLFCFVGDGDRKNPYISPLYGEFIGFPPVFFCVGENEMLLDDTLAVKAKMDRSGIHTVLEKQPKMFHTYILCMNSMPESKRSYNELKKFVKELI